MRKIKTYDCGVRLVVEKTKHKACTCGIGITCGSTSERKDEFGLAHFLEHLFFKSTKSRSTKQIANELEGLGTRINAETSHDRTFYYFRSINENFEKSFLIYCDMFFNGAFNKEEVDKERKVVLEEIKVYEDDSLSKLDDSCSKFLYNKTPYEHNVLGDPKVIENISIAKIKAFKNRNYKPENIVITVAGGIRFAKVDRLVKKYFCNNFKTKTKPELIDIKPYDITYSKKYFSIQKEDKQVNLLIYIKSENVNDTDLRYARSYYQSIMGSGLSSRMFMYLREQQGLCYSTRLSAAIMNKAGNLAFYIGAAPEKLEACVKGIKFLIKEAAEKGFTEKEFNKAKNKIKASLIFSGGTGALARGNFGGLITYGKIKTDKEILKRYENITLEQVNDYAKRVATEENFLVAAIGNKIDIKTLKLFEK